MDKDQRAKCYNCYRPLSSCMCSHIKQIKTATKFVILMHPREFKKTKNGTGRFTHLSLSNSQLFIDIDFTNHEKVNEIINDEKNICFVLYPSKESLNIAAEKIDTQNKQLVIFIIDSTWACSVKMLRLSQNIRSLAHISFTHTKTSQFQIKEQPNEFCLSTIESTLSVLELFNAQGIEKLSQDALEQFLDPFKAMIAYQLKYLTCKDENMDRNSFKS